MPELPAGTVTFLFTDIENSTKLLKQLGAERYGQVLSEQRALLRAVFEQFQGTEVDTQGDSFFVSFPQASRAVAGAAQIQHALAGHAWPDGVAVRVRMGLHTGEPLVAEEGYVGMDVHRAARIAHVGHGGQVLLSEASAALLKHDLPDGVHLKDLGQYKLKDLRSPRQIYQLIIEDLPDSFPDLKARQVRPPSPHKKQDPPQSLAFISQADSQPSTGSEIFVAREEELEALDGYLTKAISGNGMMAFITGGAGRGKTALMDAFALRAMDAHPNLLVVSGQCNAFSGSGDPYLPFREVLSMLAGDVEAKWEAGTITTSQARHLWHSSPFVAETILEQGSDLIDTFVPAREVRKRLTALQGTDPDLTQVLFALEDKAHVTLASYDQAGLFDEYERVLRAVAAQNPIVILLDDLHWADAGSLELLFHLSKRLSGSRLLLIAGYRSGIMSNEEDARKKTLGSLLVEFKRQFGDVWLDLSKSSVEQDREFVDLLLESEPNSYPAAFREALYIHTRGHPLFTVELLRSLQATGDVYQDEEGSWNAKIDLDWDALPARVEAVIEQRLLPLNDTEREILSVASVEGEVFTAQVVGQLLDLNERQLLGALSRDIKNRHRIIMEHEEIAVGDQFLARYEFRHAMFQQYLYGSLSPAERRLLHGEIGEILEDLYDTDSEDNVAQLAHHYRLSGNRQKAIHYSQKAAERAAALFAFEDAIEYITRALELIKPDQQPDLHATLLEQLGDLHHSRGEYFMAISPYEQALARRNELPDSETMTLIRLHRKIGTAITYLPMYEDRQRYETVGADHLHRGLRLAANEPPHIETVRLLVALASVGYFSTWPERILISGEKYARRAIDMAEQLDAPVELASALNALAVLYGVRGLYRERLQISLRQLELSQDPRFKDQREKARILMQTGRFLTHVGEYEQALPYLDQAEALAGKIHALDLLLISVRYQATCWFYLDRWVEVLEVEYKLQELEQSYPDFVERAGANCFLAGLFASVYALQGELGRGYRLREESRDIMVALSGPEERWDRDNLW